MMKKVYTYTLLTLVGVLTLLLTFACRGRDEMRVVPLGEEEAERIRIVAEIAPFQSKLPNPLRATDGKEGQITEGGESPFEQNVREDLEIERRVDYAMLYIYRDQKRVKTIFYHTVTFTDGIPEPFEGLEVKSFGTEGRFLTFDTELEPGDYNFLLLVNDKPSIEAARKGQIRNPEEPTEASTLSSKTLGGERKMVGGVWQEPNLMPMVGQQLINVRRLKEGEQEPMVVSPAINIERVYARVALTITTAKDASKAEYINDLVEYAQPDPRDYAPNPTAANRKTLGSFLDLVDKKERQACYIVLPLKDEWTASIGSEVPYHWRRYGKPASWMESIDSYRAMVKEPYRIDFDPLKMYWNGSVPANGIKKVYQEMPKYVNSEDSELKDNYFYILPMSIKGAEEEDMPYIHLALSFLEHPDQDGKDVYHYRIPLYTLEKGKKEGDPNEKVFTIRRNTNYVIHLRLLGDGLEIILEDGIKVLPWKVVKQDIPIDPDEPGNADPLPLWPQS